MPKDKIRILLADDTLIAREGWKKILESASDMVVVGEATRATEAIQKARDLQPDIMLIDLKWFGDETAGGAAIGEIKSQVPHVKIIAVTGHEGLIRDARGAGADSALLKTFTREELIKTILDLSERNKNHEDYALSPDRFSPRELEIIKNLADGLSDQEIADVMEIAPASVKIHVKSILEKLGVNNRRDAVAIALRQGIVIIDRAGRKDK